MIDYSEETLLRAARLASGRLLDNSIRENHITDLDYQVNTIEQILYK